MACTNDPFDAEVDSSIDGQDRIALLAAMLANGGIQFADCELEQIDLKALIEEMHRNRHQLIVRLIARAIAADIDPSRSTDEGGAT
jgi:hypothetical protein